MKVKIADNKTVLTASTKLAFAAGLGVVFGLVAGLSIGWRYAALIGWDVALFGYLMSTWPRILKYDGQLVKQHALREDPSRVTADVVLIGASIASLAAVVLVLLKAEGSTGATQVGQATLGLVSVVLSWLLVHTVYALRYAELYYQQTQPPIDFGDTKTPTYLDFAYMAFTLGMTFQVSDTTVKTRGLRRYVLQHAFLAYLFGTIIIATTINLIAGLGK